VLELKKLITINSFHRTLSVIKFIWCWKANSKFRFSKRCNANLNIQKYTQSLNTEAGYAILIATVPLNTLFQCWTNGQIKSQHSSFCLKTQHTYLFASTYNFHWLLFIGLFSFCPEYDMLCSIHNTKIHTNRFVFQRIQDSYISW
jgi:hypothetical protein